MPYRKEETRRFDRFGHRQPDSGRGGGPDNRTEAYSLQHRFLIQAMTDGG